MTKEDRDIQRKLKVLRHAEKIGDVGKTCRYFGIGRSSFYRWKASFERNGACNIVELQHLFGLLV
ncbi:helix-turn-helix domain-containing protein [Sphingorhabdus sp.]|uniref:helix-turn-helix domain-containing protein n=1 Tax=Sphingorhabdus sp. TaxID=1902408 RepID=UPI0037C9FC03